MSEEKVYQEWDYKLIPSSYGELKGVKRYYRVFYGTVHWRFSDPDNFHKACIVFVQFGSTSEFNEARKRGEIKFDYPCHILGEDFRKVTEAMQELQNRFG